VKIRALPLTVTNWNDVPALRHAEESGEAIWPAFTVGELPVRVSTGSWCGRGIVPRALEGELHTELKDRRHLIAGTSHQAADFAHPGVDAAPTIERSR
jgi:hypothetical protein